MRFKEFDQKNYAWGDVKGSLDKQFGHNKDTKTQTTGQQTSQILARLKKWIAGAKAALTSENDQATQQQVDQLKQTQKDFEQGKLPPDQAMEKFIGILEKIGPVDKLGKAIDMFLPMLKGMQGMSQKPTEERDLQNTIDALERFRQKLMPNPSQTPGINV